MQLAEIKNKERTSERLKEIAKKGMTLVGTAQFGIKGVMSGLYIEMVWNYGNKEWGVYMEFVDGLLKNSKLN